MIQSWALRLKLHTETLGGTVYDTNCESYAVINLALDRRARSAESPGRAVEHRGTRVRAGASGEESFSPSPKVTVRL